MSDPTTYKVHIPVIVKRETPPPPREVIHHIQHHHHVVKEEKPAPKVPTIEIEHEDDDNDKLIDDLVSKFKPKKHEIHVIVGDEFTPGQELPTRQTDYSVKLG